MIALMVFSLIVGVALTLVEPEKARPLTALAESVLAVSMKVIDFAMAIAPYGVAGLLFQLVVKTGMGLMASLAGYVVCVIGGLLFQQFVVYGIMLKLVAKIGPIDFFRKVQEAALTAFSTASSAATLPTSLRVCEEALGIPRRIGSFVLTVGATANQNGTALFEGVTVLFLAQVFGVALSLEQQIVVVLMSVMAGVGTAGVPGGSLPLIVLVLQSVGVPAEGIGIVLGVDRLLDMCRTTLNVTGDLVIAQLVASSEPTMGNAGKTIPAE
jgi:DAACS family dicarboxylate/amino acid:cation (Na+ or H+) symporter